MAHMGCVCGNSMWDGTGEIVYDVYKIDDIKKYMESYPELDNLDKSYESENNNLEYNTYFWKCNKCETIHAWTLKPKECFRRYEIIQNDVKIKIDDILKMKELLPININEYDYFELVPYKELILKNPVRPEKYFISDDLSKAYIYNTEKNIIEKTYDLKYERYSNVDLDIKSENDKLIYTLNKTNNEPDYVVENGNRILIENDDYPHKEVHYMIEEKSRKGSISYENPSIKPEIYNKNNMDEFYSMYEKKEKYRYIYVEYLDMPNDRMYCYLSNGDEVKKGDIVKIDRVYEETYGRVVNIVDYKKEEVPYPLDKMKVIKEVIKDAGEKKIIELHYEHYDLVIAHKYSFENEKMLKENQKCGCFYCCEIFDSVEIEEWCDDKNDGTAICPKCGIDSVIGEKSGLPITKEFLKEMNKYWF